MKTKVTEVERAILLGRRDTLVQEVQALKVNAPGRADPEFRHRFYREDLQSKARQILAIDRRLGRI